MRRLQFCALIVVSSCALWLDATTSGSAFETTVAGGYNPVLKRCAHEYGWHYNRWGFYVFGPYRRCVRMRSEGRMQPRTGYAVTVIRQYYFPNAKCISGNGWHYDPFGHRVKGFWRSCNSH